MTVTTETDASPDAAVELSLPERVARYGRMLAVQGRIKEVIDAEKPLLREAMKRAGKIVGTKRFSHAYDKGHEVTFTLKGGEGTDDKIAVSDMDALAEWAETHHPSEVETIIKVRDAFLNNVLLPSLVGTGAGVFDSEGNEVPGLRFVPGSPATEDYDTFGTHWSNKAAKDLAVGEVLDGLGDVLAIESGDQQ